MIPGEIVTADGEVELNAGRETRTLRVMNTGDRPIQVGSHFEFSRVNDALSFDRDARARASGWTSRRGRRCASSPGPSCDVDAGRARRHPHRARPAVRISRERYAALYGPTVGDRVRLADTDLWLEVEEDRCVGGDEAVFGGGKTIRESMLQGVRRRARTR